MDLNVIADKLAEPYAQLRRISEMYADHQAERLRQEGRMRSLTVKPDAYAVYAESMKSLEGSLSKQLVATYKDVAPTDVIMWQENTSGIGAHMLARLLGNLGHPRLATPKHWAINDSLKDDEFGDAENPKRALVDGEPYLRGVGQLWQLCGHGAPIRRHAGMTQDEAFALARKFDWKAMQGQVK